MAGLRLSCVLPEVTEEQWQISFLSMVRTLLLQVEEKEAHSIAEQLNPYPSIFLSTKIPLSRGNDSYALCHCWSKFWFVFLFILIMTKSKIF